MRRILALLLLFALALSGCTGDDDDNDGDDNGDGTETPEPSRELPEDMTFTGTVPAGTAPSNFVDGTKCGPEDFCIRHPFTLESSATATLTLTWTNPANDFDLALDSGGAELQYVGGTPPATEEVLTASLGPGDYDAVVVPWLVVAGTYTLTIEFS